MTRPTAQDTERTDISYTENVSGSLEDECNFNIDFLNSI